VSRRAMEDEHDEMEHELRPWRSRRSRQFL
jgi:hypothetical protein